MNNTFFVEPSMIPSSDRVHIHNILLYTEEQFISVRGVYDPDEDDEIIIIGISAVDQINKGEIYSYMDRKQYMNELEALI